jgi:hypothetical protein
MNQENININIKQNDINDNYYNNDDYDENVIKKMAFVFNAIEDGWKVKKRGKSYVFSKPHENKTEIFSDTYLREFIETTFRKSSAKHLAQI